MSDMAEKWWAEQVAELRAELGREPTEAEIEVRRAALWNASVRNLRAPAAIDVQPSVRVKL